MEFYKLYHILHRRTDWLELYRWQRKEMMPEWYKEKQAQARLAMQKLRLATLCISAAYGGNDYFLE